MAGNLGTIYVGVRAATDKLQTDLAKARTLAGKAASGISDQLSRIKTAAQVAGFVALEEAIRRTIMIGAGFEQTMAGVKGVMRASDMEFQNLTAAAREMGEKTEWSASQAADALKFLGMAGFNASKAIAALPGVLDLATGSGIGLGEAADIATNALSAMQLPVEQLTRINDVFAATITRSNTNMQMMAESFKYAAPVAKAFGVSVEEVSAMIGILGNSGIQGSMAGTQLAFAFQNVGKAAKKLSMDEGSTLIDVLKKLNSTGANANEIMALFGMRAGRAALVLKDAIPQYERFKGVLQSSEGESKKLAETMRNTTTGAFKELMSVIESVAIDAFDTFKGSLVETIKASTAWVRVNKEMLIDVLPKLVKGVMTFGQYAWDAAQMSVKGWGLIYKYTKDFLKWFNTASIDAIDFFVKGWIDLKYSALSVFKILELSFDMLVNELIMAWRDFIKLVETGVSATEKLTRVNTGAGVALIRYRMELNRAIKSSSDYKTEIDNISAAKAIELQAHENIVKELKTEVIPILADIPTKMKPAQTAVEDYIDSWRYHTTKMATVAREDQEYIDSWRAKAVDLKLISMEVVDDTALAYSGFFGGLEKGWKESTQHVKDYDTAMTYLGEVTAKAVHTAMSDTLFSALKGDFDDMGKIWENVLDTMLKAFTDYLAKMLVEWAAAQASKAAMEYLGSGSSGAGAAAAGGSLVGGAAKGAGGALTLGTIGTYIAQAAGASVSSGVGAAGIYATGIAMILSNMGAFEHGKQKKIVDEQVSGTTGFQPGGYANTRFDMMDKVQNLKKTSYFDDTPYWAIEHATAAQRFAEDFNLRGIVDVVAGNVQKSINKMPGQLAKSIESKLASKPIDLGYYFDIHGPDQLVAGLTQYATEMSKRFETAYQQSIQEALLQKGYGGAGYKDLMQAGNTSEAIQLLVQQYEHMTELSKNTIGDAFSKSLDTGSFQYFKEALHQNIYESTKAGLIDAFMQNVVYQDLLEPVFKEMSNIVTGFADNPTSYYNSALINQRLDPVMQKLGDSMPILETVFTKFSDFLSVFSERLAPPTQTNVNINGVVTTNDVDTWLADRQTSNSNNKVGQSVAFNNISNAGFIV